VAVNYQSILNPAFRVHVLVVRIKNPWEMTITYFPNSTPSNPQVPWRIVRFLTMTEPVIHKKRPQSRGDASAVLRSQKIKHTDIVILPSTIKCIQWILYML
jgi:hypothetical protein